MIFLQRDASHVADVPFAGERARILKDGAVVRDWSEGGVLADVPQGDGYTLEIQRGAEIVAETLAIGIVVGTIGQSNMGGWSGNDGPRTGVIDALPQTYGLSGGRWGEVQGDAARTFANALAQGTGVPVAIVDGSLGGTSLLSQYASASGSWQSTDPNGLFARFVSQLGAVGGSAELVLWIQGENDAQAGATTAEYLAGLNGLFDRVRAEIAPGLVIASTLGSSIWNDPDWTPMMSEARAAAIREAQGLADAARDDVVFVQSADLGLQDVIHRTTVASAIEAMRMAEVYLARAGGAGLPKLAGGAGDDALVGSDAAETIEALVGDDRIDAGEGNDVVAAGTGADEIDGGAGNDLLSGGEGDDVIRGGIGNDRITGDGGNDRIEAGLGNDIVAGGSGNDWIDGGEGNDALDGGLGDDALLGGAGNDTIRLGAGSDAIDGGDGDDFILVENYRPYNYRGAPFGYSAVEGGAGSDTIAAAASGTVIGLRQLSGVEVVTAAGYSGVRIAGSDGADLIDLSATTLVGIASIDTGAGDDAVLGSAGDDRILGGAGDDRLVGGAGDDVLAGGAGDDRIEGGEGFDLLQLTGRYSETRIDRAAGMLGNRIDGADAISGIERINFLDGVYDWASDTFTVGPPASGVSITGTAGNDQIGPTLSVGQQPKATDFNDTLYGLAGDDRLDGSVGADTLVGGTGNDTYFVDDPLDRVVEAAGEGTDFVYASASYTLSDNVERLILTGTAAIDGTGNALANFLTGNDSSNTLSGGAGDDRLYGEGGADTLIGGSGNDLYYVDSGDDRVVEAAGEGSDTVFATATFTLADNVENLNLTGSAAIDGTGNALANTILGNAAANVIRGGAGNDSLTGGGGDDTLYGEADNDRLDGGSGADRLVGGRGDDTYVVDDAGDVVEELAGEGTDTVNASVSHVLSANVERLVLTGTAAIDATGNAAANVLTGNAADNRLVGGGGDDTIDGGAGFDTAVYAGAFAAYAINRATGVVSGGLDGADKLRNVEALRFANGTYDWASGSFTRFNAAPTLAVGAQSALLVEAAAGWPGTATAERLLRPSDPDAGDAATFDSAGWTVVDATRWMKSGIYGTVVLDPTTGRLAYGLDDARAATNALADGASARDSFAVAVRDAMGASTETFVDFDVRGSDDPAVLSAARATVTEGDAAEALGASGTLGLTDPDSETRFVASTLKGAFGTFAIAATGAWSFAADGAHDALAASESRVERFAVAATDGTTTTVEIEILGSNDAPTLGLGAQSGRLVEATVASAGAATASIALLPSDADAGDAIIFDLSGWTALDAGRWMRTGLYGVATLDTANGRLTYELDNARAATNALATGTVARDGFVVTVRDRSGASASATAEFAIAGASDGVAITGTSGADWIGPTSSAPRQPKATGFDDALEGLAGDDRLDGGAGADRLVGGTGNDAYFVDDAGDEVVELANEGTDFVYATITYALTENVERLFLSGTEAIDGTGNALANFLTGNAAANVLRGGAGDDRLYGEGGADTLIGGEGNDLYYVDRSDDRIVEAAGEGLDGVNASASFALTDNVENLSLVGMGAIDGIGNDLANVILGNGAANVLDGGGGSDYLRGYAGNDTFRFSAALNAKLNIDTIADFESGLDRIAMDGRVFAALGLGRLQASDFVVGKAATTADQNIVYDNATGRLYYDADGVGGTAQVQFAWLSGAPTLDFGSFDVL